MTLQAPLPGAMDLPGLRLVRDDDSATGGSPLTPHQARTPQEASSRMHRRFPSAVSLASSGVDDYWDAQSVGMPGEDFSGRLGCVTRLRRGWGPDPEDPPLVMPALRRSCMCGMAVLGIGGRHPWAA